MCSSGTIEHATGPAPAGVRPAIDRFVRQFRASPGFAIACCMFGGIALLSPSLGTGLVADDLLHQLMLRDAPGLPVAGRGPLDLFRFADGDPETARALTNAGVFPWWADPKAVLAFFRPLASLTHAADHSFWPEHAALMHAQSLLWYGVLIAVVGVTYARLGASRRGFALALLLFAIDDAHAPVVGWIANRNALIALCFALPALAVHDRMRRGGSVHGVWLGPLLLAAGLSGGEVALSVCAYLVAYAAFLDRGPWYLRYGSLLPYVLVLVSWKVSCLQLGYGAAGSGLYVDPLSDPLGFGRAVSERLPVLTVALLAGPFSDFWELYPLLSPWLRAGVLAFALPVIMLFLLLLKPLLGVRRVRFWAGGALLSLIPMCATFPHDRLLLAPGIGAMAIIADLIELGWAGRATSLPTRGAVLLAALHLIAAPVLAPLRAAGVGDFSRALLRSDASLPQGASVRDRQVILLNPPLDPFAAYLPIYREARHQPRPHRQLWLATGATELAVRRLDEHALELAPLGGFLSSSLQLMLRSPAPGLALGERVELAGASVSVTALTGDGRPERVILRVERQLSDPNLVWLCWRRGRYEPFELPAVGQRVVLPKADLAALLLAS